MQDLSGALSKRLHLAQVWPLVAVGLLGLVLAAAAWITVSVWEERLAKARFNAVAGDYAAVLQSGLDGYLDRIRALRAFYDASQGVTRREFDLFTSQILSGQGSAMRLLWCPRVDRQERAVFESSVQRSGLTDFSIKDWAPTGNVRDATEREEYFPILYSSVSNSRTATFGTDLHYERARSSAIRRARDGDTMATAQTSNSAIPLGGSARGSSLSCRYTSQAPFTTVSSAGAEIWKGLSPGPFRPPRFSMQFLHKRFSRPASICSSTPQIMIRMLLRFMRASSVVQTR